MASILIAFSLDAWWDNRGDAAALSAELHSIDEELAENIQLIGFLIDLMRRLITARVEGLEAGTLALSGRIDGVGEDMRQRFRVVNDRLAQLAA